MNNLNKEKSQILTIFLITLLVLGGFFGLLLSLTGNFLPRRASNRANNATENDSEIVSGALKSITAVPQGIYKYGGSATMVPIRQVIGRLVSSTFPGFQLRNVDPLGSAPNSTTGINMMLSGELSFSDSSRSVKPEEHEIADSLGFELQQLPVAIDGIAIVVHPELDIEGLTLDQLKSIFLGQVTNWLEVGGPDLAIQPFSMLASTSGTANFFVERILDGEPLSARVEVINETTPVLRRVASIPGSIYYVSAPLAVPQCSVKTLPLATAEGRPFIAPYQTPAIDLSNCPEQRNQINKDAFRNGTYPLTRRLFVVTKKGESDDAIAGQAYGDIVLSNEGQALVEEAGFVNIR